MIFFYLFIFIISLIVIIKSGTWLVKSLVYISRFLKLSEYVIAFILMAFATSVPELFVGLTAAVKGIPSISFGNIIGANILNLTLAMGLVIMLAKGIKVDKQPARKDAWLIFFMALLPIFLAFDGAGLSRIDGFILLLFFIWYVSRLMGRRKQFVETLNRLKNNSHSLKKFLKNTGLFFAGLIFLLVSAWGVVWSSSLIAGQFGLSLTLMGMVLVAIGTTLPEISFGARSVLLEHEQMTIGNFIGSVAFNSLVILGLVAVICPFQIETRLIVISGLFLILSLLVFNIFLRTRKRLSYREGTILLLLYVLFLVVMFFAS